MRFAGDWWKKARWYCRHLAEKSSTFDNVVNFLCEIPSERSSFWLEFECLDSCPDFLVAYQVHEFGRCAFREAVWTSLRHQSLFSADPENITELFTVPESLTNQAGELKPLTSHPRSLVLRSASATYLPQRFLRGFLPEVLLQNHFHFWQISENCIEGRQEKT